MPDELLPAQVRTEECVLHGVGRHLGVTARNGERPDQPGVVTPKDLIEPGTRRQRDLGPSVVHRSELSTSEQP